MVTSTSGSSSSTFNGNGINTNGISVGSDGKIQVSGFSSGIDWQSLIKAQITADSVPITNLQTKITTNNTLSQAYSDLQTKVQALQNALEPLSNDLSFGAANVFKSMTGSGTTTAKVGAPSGYTPSDINSLITTSFTTKAQTASHTITVEQLAQAQQIASDAQAGNNTDLNLSGTLTINGKDVSIATTDSLLDVRDKINAAGANVNATIVSSDSTHSYLILTSGSTGTGSNAITLTQTALSDSLGLTNGSATPKNELQPAQDAIIDVDGITGITRSTNVIGDVIDGVTLSLQKAEPNTVINLQVQPDLNTIKTAIGTFVSAYNDLKAFISDQNTAKDRNGDGTVDPGEFGPLYNNSLMRQISDQLTFLVGTQNFNNQDGYQSLSQIGVSMGSDYTLSIDDSTMDPKLLANVGQVASLFGFSSTTSDSRINVVSRTAATTSGTYYLNFDGTDSNGMVGGGNISTSSGAGAGTDGSLVFDGNNVVTASGTTNANGLVLGFTNTTPNLGPITDIQVTVSRGIADTFGDYFGSLTAANTGTFATLTSQITDQNASYQSQIDTLNTRLDKEKTDLTNKYTAMETALAQLSSLQNTISSYFKSATSGSSSGG